MDFLIEIIRLGLKNLRLHMLRSVLTSLGIILGVAAVIIMVSIGEGNKQAALRDIQALGATNIIVRSERPPESAAFGSEERAVMVRYGLTRQDHKRIEQFISDAVSIVPLKAVGDEVSFAHRRMTSQTFGTTPRLLESANLRIDKGRYLSRHDMEARSPVAVIGAEVARKFFALEDPLTSSIRIGSSVFRVIGVMEPVGLAGGRGSQLVGRDWNNDVHIPITTAELVFSDIISRRQSGSTTTEEIELSEIYITAGSSEEVEGMAARVRRLIETAHADESDVQVIVPWELLEAQKKTEMIWNIVLISIAAISLLVGGIGIMNIMLASVTERTREIGIRRALGATRRHIIAQFLVETGALSTIGGLLGIALGIGVSLGIEVFVPWLIKLRFMRQFVAEQIQLETQVTMWSVVTSFIVAAAVGLVFGIYPAIVASRKDPVEALRHD